MKRKFNGVLLLLTTAIISLASAVEFRTWTNKDGRKVEAMMINATPEVVSVQLRNGKTYEIPIGNLSSEDAAYIIAERDATPAATGGGSGSPSFAPDDLISAFVDPDTWKTVGAKLPGLWREVSKTGSETISQLAPGAAILGQPGIVTAHFGAENRLSQISISYLEEGDFVGFRGDGAVDPTAEKLPIGSVADRKVAFDRQFKDLDTVLNGNLAKLSGAPGKQLSVGRGELRRRITQFAVGDLLLSLDLQEGHLVALVIQPAESFSRRMIQDGATLAGRGEDARKNVEVSPNGDVKIMNVPMIEQGSRGYCAIGTLAMITRYYRMNLDIDALAAAGGFTEGAPNGNIPRIYEEAAKLARLNYKSADKFEFSRVKRLIDRGQPILVWRWFSYERNDVHTEYAEKIKADPSVELPKANRADKAQWPKEVNGGHASLITGYNSKRGEVFFTESWSRDFEHRRMRVDEMEATVYDVFTFAP